MENRINRIPATSLKVSQFGSATVYDRSLLKTPCFHPRIYPPTFPFEASRSVFLREVVVLACVRERTWAQGTCSLVEEPYLRGPLNVARELHVRLSILAAARLVFVLSNRGWTGPRTYSAGNTNVWLQEFAFKCTWDDGCCFLDSL